MWEMCYFETKLRGIYHPLDMTREQEMQRLEANACSNCGRFCGKEEVLHAHHLHFLAKDNLLGFLCPTCNKMASKIQPAVLWAMNLSGFEGKHFMSAMNQPAVRKSQKNAEKIGANSTQEILECKSGTLVVKAPHSDPSPQKPP